MRFTTGERKIRRTRQIEVQTVSAVYSRQMARNPRHIGITVWRALQLRCPACGRGAIVRRPFHISRQCVACAAIFQREEGFFVGAIMANVVATEVIILLIYLACLLFTGIGEQTILIILFVVGVTFPLLFYHHSWALWLAMDHLIEGLPKSGAEAPGQPSTKLRRTLH